MFIGIRLETILTCPFFMKTFHSMTWVTLTASTLLLAGCNRDQTSPASSPAAPPKPTERIPTNATPPKPAAPDRLTPEAGIDKVQKAFSQSPQETRARIEEAIASIQAGQTKEGIGRLKMVDAESDLDEPQQQSIKDLIRAVQ